MSKAVTSGAQQSARQQISAEAVPTLADVLTQVHASAEGLSDVEARRRLNEIGPNEPSSTRRSAGMVQFLRLFLNPLVAILLIASLISVVLGDIVNASVIVTIVLLSAMLNFVQTYRSQQAVERLREQVSPTASVFRDGESSEVPRRVLVPGDVIRLTAGDLVPADGYLLAAVDLHVQQAALTGESLPVEKTTYTEKAEAAQNPADDPGRVFLRTSIVSGSATTVISATGKHTAFGDIVERLAKRPPETEFERGTRHFGYLIMQTVIFLILFVFFVSVVFHHPLFESVLFAVALAVGLTPEFLPMITTVTLGQGALRMAKQKVIVKHLDAMQNFGSIDVLCSDKTGTVTSGNMALDHAMDLHEQPSEQVLRFAYLNSYHGTGIKSPLDASILHAQTLDVSVYSKQGEIPFDFERRRLSIIVTERDHPQTALLISKGAPENVIEVCSAYELDGKQNPLDGDARARYEEIYQRLSTQGYRVLALAYRTFPVQASYRKADEEHLTLLGFLTFSDPLLAGVAQMLQTLDRDGIGVKILTGDNELVTRHVCEQAGLPTGRIVLGHELEHMSDTALTQIVEQVHVFARVSPAQKSRILLALKKRGHVVGFLGDGINDAPSLHAAVGISVANGADVAKDAAGILLLEPGLQVLHQGIIEGRKAFGNVIKYLLMGTSSNFGNMFSMAGAFLFLPSVPAHVADTDLAQ
jgi:P-type Mg2+ transporter